MYLEPPVSVIGQGLSTYKKNIKQAKHVLGTQGKQVYLRIQDHV
jgi:hypothetical protein